MLNETRFSTRPLYLQVRDMLVERIATGQWKPGTAIPNEIQLSRELGVSVGTVRKSLDAMEGELLVSRKQGRGTFVNDQTSDHLAYRFNNLREEDGRHLVGEPQQDGQSAPAAADADECRRLQLRQGEQVMRIQRTRLRRDRPYMLERIALPASRFPGLAERTGFTDQIVSLAQEYGMLLGRAVEQVTATTAEADTAAQLGVPEGSSLLRLDRVVYAIDGRPVEWRVAHCNMQGNVYVVEIG